MQSEVNLYIFDPNIRAGGGKERGGKGERVITERGLKGEVGEREEQGVEGRRGSWSREEGN